MLYQKKYKLLICIVSLMAFGPTAFAQVVMTYSWGDAEWTGYEFSDSGRKGVYSGFGTASAYGGGTEGVVARVGEAGEVISTSWIDANISLPPGMTSADLTGATLDFVLYDVTLSGNLDIYHLSSPANDPAAVGDFEYNDDPGLAPGGPSGAPVAGYSIIGSAAASSSSSLNDLVAVNYSGGAASFAAGGDPDIGPFAGMTRDDIIDAATVSISLDLATVQSELDGDESLSLLLGTTENPYLYVDGKGAANRDYWEYSGDGGGSANTYGVLGSGREMQLNLEFVSIPEPSFAAIPLLGLCVIALRRRRREP